MAVRTWLLIAEVALVGALAALAFPSDGSALATQYRVALTATGPSPSTLKMAAGAFLLFVNNDSVTHEVVFANGRCSLSVAPGERVGPGAQVGGPENQHPNCNDNFPFYVGRYAYTVDGKFPGRVATVPARRSVTLMARAHRIRRGTQLTLHGRLTFGSLGGAGVLTKAPFPVLVLARHDRRHPFERIARLVVRLVNRPGKGSGYFWHLRVRPGMQTTYVAEAKGQLPGGRVWKRARSGTFTVRIRG